MSVEATEKKLIEKDTTITTTTTETNNLPTTDTVPISTNVLPDDKKIGHYTVGELKALNKKEERTDEELLKYLEDAIFYKMLSKLASAKLTDFDNNAMLKKMIELEEGISGSDSQNIVENLGKIKFRNFDYQKMLKKMEEDTGSKHFNAQDILEKLSNAELTEFDTQQVMKKLRETKITFFDFSGMQEEVKKETQSTNFNAQLNKYIEFRNALLLKNENNKSHIYTGEYLLYSKLIESLSYVEVMLHEIESYFNNTENLSDEQKEKLKRKIANLKESKEIISDKLDLLEKPEMLIKDNPYFNVPNTMENLRENRKFNLERKKKILDDIKKSNAKEMPTPSQTELTQQRSQETTTNTVVDTSPTLSTTNTIPPDQQSDGTVLEKTAAASQATTQSDEDKILLEAAVDHQKIIAAHFEAEDEIFDDEILAEAAACHLQVVMEYFKKDSDFFKKLFKDIGYFSKKGDSFYYQLLKKIAWAKFKKFDDEEMFKKLTETKLTDNDSKKILETLPNIKFRNFDYQKMLEKMKEEAKAKKTEAEKTESTDLSAQDILKELTKAKLTDADMQEMLKELAKINFEGFDFQKMQNEILNKTKSTNFVSQVNNYIEFRTDLLQKNKDDDNLISHIYGAEFKLYQKLIAELAGTEIRLYKTENDLNNRQDLSNEKKEKLKNKIAHLKEGKEIILKKLDVLEKSNVLMNNNPYFEPPFTAMKDLRKNASFTQKELKAKKEYEEFKKEQSAGGVLSKKKIFNDMRQIDTKVRILQQDELIRQNKNFSDFAFSYFSSLNVESLYKFVYEDIEKPKYNPRASKPIPPKIARILDIFDRNYEKYGKNTRANVVEWIEEIKTISVEKEEYQEIKKWFEKCLNDIKPKNTEKLKETEESKESKALKELIQRIGFAVEANDVGEKIPYGNPWEILDISYGASEEEIREQYKKLLQDIEQKGKIPEKDKEKTIIDKKSLEDIKEEKNTLENNKESTDNEESLEDVKKEKSVPENDNTLKEKSSNDLKPDQNPPKKNTKDSLKAAQKLLLLYRRQETLVAKMKADEEDLKNDSGGVFAAIGAIRTSLSKKH